MQKFFKKIRVVIVLMIILAILVIGASACTAISARSRIVASYDGSPLSGEVIQARKDLEPQCILVLGCAVWAGNQPSPMLKDRLDAAIELYKAGAAPKILMSGDNSVKEYSEPDCMLAYALEQGVPEEDIFLDFAGFSTYDSIYRAKAVFTAERFILVTQKYHMFRALSLCKALGVEALGTSSDQRKYTGRYYREAREVLARDKDLIKGLLKPNPKFLGEEIPINGDGTVTHVN